MEGQELIDRAEEDGLVIVRFEAENYKRLKAVQITPEGNVIKLSGANAQGKTSILDGISETLGGGKAAKDTSKPIHEGATKAHVTIDLGDMIATRRWAKGGKTTLTVEGKDGTKFKSPQTMFDAMIGRFAFDPLEFAQLSSKEQVIALLKLVTLDIDLDKIAADRQAAFEQRTAVNREVKTLTAQLEGLAPFDSDAPDEEISSSDILADLDEAQSVARSNDEQRKNLEDFLVEATELRAEIEHKQEQLDKMVEQGKQMRANVGALVDLPVDIIRESLHSVEETNKAVRANAEHEKITGQLKESEDKADALTHALEDMDDTRSDALKKAKFPIDGLSFGEDGVTYNGIPFTQSSDAEILCVSFAIAMALNPRLRVIRIRNGSLLDSKNLALIEEMAKGKGYQVWIEMVDESGKIGIVIEDGQVKSQS